MCKEIVLLSGSRCRGILLQASITMPLLTFIGDSSGSAIDLLRWLFNMRAYQTIATAASAITIINIINIIIRSSNNR